MFNRVFLFIFNVTFSHVHRFVARSLLQTRAYLKGTRVFGDDEVVQELHKEKALRVQRYNQDHSSGQPAVVKRGDDDGNAMEVDDSGPSSSKTAATRKTATTKRAPAKGKGKAAATVTPAETGSSSSAAASPPISSSSRSSRVRPSTAVDLTSDGVDDDFGAYVPSSVIGTESRTARRLASEKTDDSIIEEDELEDIRSARILGKGKGKGKQAESRSKRAKVDATIGGCGVICTVNDHFHSSRNHPTRKSLTYRTQRAPRTLSRRVTWAAWYRTRTTNRKSLRHRSAARLLPPKHRQRPRQLLRKRRQARAQLLRFSQSCSLAGKRMVAAERHHRPHGHRVVLVHSGESCVVEKKRGHECQIRNELRKSNGLYFRAAPYCHALELHVHLVLVAHWLEDHVGRHILDAEQTVEVHGCTLLVLQREFAYQRACQSEYEITTTRTLPFCSP